MELLKYIMISIPMISAMTCGVIFMIIFHKSLSLIENRVRQTLGTYYFLMIIIWLITNVSIDYGSSKFFTLPMYFVFIHVIQVTFYHFICYVVPSSKEFNISHYKVTIAIFVLVTALVFTLWTTKGIESLDIVSFFDRYLYVFTLINMTYYTSLCWIRILKKQRNRSGEFGNKWLYYLLAFRTLFVVLFALNIGRIMIIDIVLMLLIPTQHILITFNILHSNIVTKLNNECKTNIMLASGQIVTIENNRINDSDVNEAVGQEGSLLTEQEVVDFFSKEKPYLNKDFKLDDLVKHFHVNRTYMSKFINVTFNMNFTQYINQWRLSEVEQLFEKDSSLYIEEAIVKAGFSNYRHYLRVKENFESKV